MDGQDPAEVQEVRVRGQDREGQADAHRTDQEVRVRSLDSLATAGVEVENTGTEPLESLRYFGPDTYDSVPNVGDYKN